MSTVWSWIKVHAKTFAAFVAGIVGNMIVNLINGTTVWPQTKQEWLQYVITSFGSAIAVWLTTNKITQRQLDKDPNVVGGVVVPDEQVPPPHVQYQPPWRPGT